MYRIVRIVCRCLCGFLHSAIVLQGALSEKSVSSSNLVRNCICFGLQLHQVFILHFSFLSYKLMMNFNLVVEIRCKTARHLQNCMLYSNLQGSKILYMLIISPVLRKSCTPREAVLKTYTYAELY